MGLGNGNPNQGNKGSNFSYELRVLKLLDKIKSNTTPGSGSGGASEITLQQLVDQGIGTVSTGIENPSLPYTISADTFFSYCIVTTGQVLIDGIEVPEGSWSWETGSNETLSQKELTGTGSVIIQTMSKP